MTVGGDGLHGRAVEGWSLLFNVVFRPTLMVIGLFMGYFVFDCMSWLIRQSFGIAVGFVLQNGWIVTNFIGLVVLLSIFVMTHVVAALMSFRMVTLLPHHLPRLIGFTSANRVDMDAFQQQAAWATGEQVAGGAQRAITSGSRQFGAAVGQLRSRPTGLISGPSNGSGSEEGGGNWGWTAPFEPLPRHHPRRVAKMSDYSGLGGALLISQQLEIVPLGRPLPTRSRENNAQAANDAAWRNQYNDLVNRYNRLLQDANRLADVQDRALNGKDGQIAELKATNASLAAEVQRLRLEVLSVRGLLDLERRVEEERTLRAQSKGVSSTSHLQHDGAS